MNPKFVVPYRKSGKNDANDAEAICEAVGRPNMRFVPVKSVEQQAVCSLHTVVSFLSYNALPLSIIVADLNGVRYRHACRCR
jgi:hypothetical protein